MNRMLTRDLELFERMHPTAASYIQAAELRYECYKLAMTKELNDWEQNRLLELLYSTPACRESWFVDQLRGDGRGIIDYILEKAEL